MFIWKFGIWSKFWGTCLRLCYFIFLFLFVFKSCQISFLPSFCLFHMSPNWSSVRDFEEDKELARLVEWLNLWNDQQKKVSHASRVHYLAEVLPLRKFCGGVCRCFSFHYLARGEKPVLALRRASLSFWHVQDQHQLFRGVASFFCFFFSPHLQNASWRCLVLFRQQPLIAADVITSITAMKTDLKKCLVFFPWHTGHSFN